MCHCPISGRQKQSLPEQEASSNTKSFFALSQQKTSQWSGPGVPILCPTGHLVRQARQAGAADALSTAGRCALISREWCCYGGKLEPSRGLEHDMVQDMSVRTHVKNIRLQSRVHGWL